MAVSRSKPHKSYTYDPDIAQRICDRLSSGEFLYKICADSGYPPQSTVRLWAANDIEGFSAMFARARAMGFDVVADSIVEIADTSRKGKVTEKKVVGRNCSTCGRDIWWRGGWKHSEDATVICAGSKAIPVVEEKIRTADMVERARLQVDARKWLLSKMRPDKYGDRSTVEMSAPGGEPLSIKVEFVDGRKDLP